LKRKIASGLILTLLAISMLTLAFNIQTAKASGTIYITSNYTFTDNIYEPIVVLADNIVIDGNGYTLQGTGSGKGINLTGRSNVTIKNMKIKAFAYGIELYGSSNNTIFGNNIANNDKGIRLWSSLNNSISGNNIANNDEGIDLWWSSNYNTISGNNITANNYWGIALHESSSNTISGNNITTSNNGYGIYLWWSSNYNTISGNNITANKYCGIELHESSSNTISGNNIANNGWYGIVLSESSNNSIGGNSFVNDGLWVYASYGNVVSDNLVNGKPLVYLEEVSDYVVEDAGQVILVKCNNITVENLNLSNTAVGVQLWKTNNTKTSENNITANKYWGIALHESSSNTISGNNITTSNNGYGILLYESSSYNSISGNNITNNYCGIWLNSSSSNIIYHNNFVHNTEQVRSLNSTNVWDDGYPSGGNYWSNHVTIDDYSGINQDEPGSDGIVDEPYVIDGDNQDNYPIAARGRVYDGIYFPLGDKSFADQVVDFIPGSDTGEIDGSAAIGPPDASKNTGPSVVGNKGDVSLGNGGSITIKFIDICLIDVDGPDLYVFEYGPAIEPFEVEISEDGSNWIDLGTVMGQPTSLDIHDKVAPSDEFHYVRITDANSDMSLYPLAGADIDAVGAIGARANNPPYQPQLSITPSLAVEDNDDLIVTVIGPTPADPDGDAVTYTYRWLVDVGTGQFLDDELAERGNHTGNTVPAADTVVGDVWRVEVTPIDEHDAVGLSAIATWQPVVVDATKPVADAGIDQTVVEDIVVSFDAGGSSDNVGIDECVWDFGDRTTGTGITVTHTYTEPGIYIVTLTVKDEAGNSDTDSIIITVERDTDGDGTPDITDTDDDNDGVNDDEDAFPLDSTETVDTDGDEIGNNADADDDNDGLSDVDDAFPLDASESVDTDRDDVGNNADTDDDNDGIPDVWEIDNGLDPLDAQDASLDPDNDGLTSLQEYLEDKDPNVYDAEAIREPRSLYIVAEVAVVGAAVTAATAALASFGGLGQSFNSAVSKLPIPDELKDFLKLYGEEIFETVDKMKLETLEKAPFITKGELAAIGISALIMTIVFGYVEANGLPRFLNPSVLAAVIPATLLSVCIVSITGVLSEALCARTCRVCRQFRLWMYGIGAFLISGFLFLFPFASPGITRYQCGEISDKTKGLIVLSKMLILLTLTIPFAGLFMLGFKIIGDAGLLLTLMTVCYSLVPLKPLAGKAVFDYRKEVSLIALVSTGILFFSFTFKLLPHVTYLVVGVVSVFLATITLIQLREAHPK